MREQKTGLSIVRPKHTLVRTRLFSTVLFTLFAGGAVSAAEFRRRTSNSRRTAPLAANRRGSRDERHFDECWFFKVEIEASQSRRGRGGGKGKEREQKTILPLTTHYKHWQMSKVNTASFQFGARSPA
jgi:hypothetical protein